MSKDETKKKKFPLWKKLLLLSGTVIVVLAAAEILLRKFYPDPPEGRWAQHHFRVGALGFSDLNNIMEPDPELFWRVKPNLKDQYVMGWVGTETFLSFKITTDPQGMRVMGGPEDAGNIVFLGDSCTFGIGVKAEETYAARTGSRLGVRARNLSCPGYTLYQGRVLLDRLGWDQKPRALVVGFGFNDRLIWDGLTDPEHARLLENRSTFMARHCRLYYCMQLALEGSLKLLRKQPDEPARRVPPEVFTTEAAVLVQRARALEVPVVFLFWPRIEWMDEPEMMHPYGALVEKLAKDENVAILDLGDTFRRNGAQALYLDGIHVNIVGHALAADRLILTLESLGAGNDQRK